MDALEYSIEPAAARRPGRPPKWTGPSLTWSTDLAAARLWATARAPYLTAALFALTPVPVEGLGTFAVDRGWRLYVDPERLAAWSIEEIGTVLVHEVHHLLRDHATRAVRSGVDESQARRWNVAADLEINDDLLDLVLPPGGCLPQALGVDEGELAETYFALLEPVPHSVLECGSGAHGVPTGWEMPGAAAPSMSEGEAELIRQQVAAEVRSLAAQGKAPKGLARWAGGFLLPKVDWRTELRSLLLQGVGVASGTSDYSYSRPNRRTGRPLRPAVVLPAMVRRVPRVAAVVDTSASMSAATLEIALTELNGVIREVLGSRAPVPVLSCDSAVHAVQRVFSASAVQLVGGGGTDMGQGLAAAWALRPSPQVVIVFTDGLTPWPSSAPTGRRVVVVLIGDAGHVPPWARAVRVGADHPPEGSR